MSYLARIVSLILATAGISFTDDGFVIPAPDGPTDDIMGDNEEPTAFAATYTSPLGWKDSGVVIHGRAWGKMEVLDMSLSDTLTIGLEFCGKTIHMNERMEPSDNDYWQLDFEIVYYSISGSEYGAYTASGGTSYGMNDYRNAPFQFFVEPTSMRSDCEPTVKVIVDWMSGAADTDDLRLYSLVAIATD